MLHHVLESSFSNIAQPLPPPPIYSSIFNATSSPHSQIALCNNQRHLVSSQSAETKNVCNAFYTPSMYSNQLAHHSSIPHSKSLDHYNEPTKLIEHNISRHSFDQPFSSNYKNYDCTEGMHAAAADRSSHYMSGLGVYHQPNCSLQNAGNIYNNRYPLPDHHYSQIDNFEHGENFVETNMGTCCHQNPHYECLNNFNSRSSKGVDYSNCSFQSK